MGHSCCSFAGVTFGRIDRDNDGNHPVTQQSATTRRSTTCRGLPPSCWIPAAVSAWWCSACSWASPAAPPPPVRRPRAVYLSLRQLQEGLRPAPPAGCLTHTLHIMTLCTEGPSMPPSGWRRPASQPLSVEGHRPATPAGSPSSECQTSVWDSTATPAGIPRTCSQLTLESGKPRTARGSCRAASATPACLGAMPPGRPCTGITRGCSSAGSRRRPTRPPSRRVRQIGAKLVSL